MTAQRGKDLLIKIGDGADPENFTTVAGLRATSLDFNAQTIDITNSDSVDMWRELLADGVKSATVAGSGVFKDAASDAALKTAFFNQTLNNLTLTQDGGANGNNGTTVLTGTGVLTVNGSIIATGPKTSSA